MDQFRNSSHQIPRRKRSVGSAFWAASHVLGRLALAVAAVGVLVAMLAERSPVFGLLRSVFPASVGQFFDSRAADSLAELPQEIRELAADAAPAPVKRGSANTTFTIGSSEATVLLCQGRPSRIAGGTWFYGDSEIQFVAGRVIGWKNSSKNPLKVR